MAVTQFVPQLTHVSRHPRAKSKKTKQKVWTNLKKNGLKNLGVLVLSQESAKVH